MVGLNFGIGSYRCMSLAWSLIGCYRVAYRQRAVNIAFAPSFRPIIPATSLARLQPSVMSLSTEANLHKDEVTGEMVSKSCVLMGRASNEISDLQ